MNTYLCSMYQCLDGHLNSYLYISSYYCYQKLLPKVLMSMKTYEFILMYEFICPLSQITIGTREDAKQFIKNKYETKHKFPNNNI